MALEQAEGQLARDAAQLKNARLDLDRYQKLLAQDSIAAQQVDQQVALVKQLEGTVKIDQAQVDNAKLQLSYTQHHRAHRRAASACGWSTRATWCTARTPTASW